MLRLGTRILRGVWISIPIGLSGFCLGGLIVGIFLLFGSLFLWPVFVVDYLKEEKRSTFLKICGFCYVLVVLFAFIRLIISGNTATESDSAGWVMISSFAGTVAIGYFVVGFDLLKGNNKPTNTGYLMPFDEMWEKFIMPLSGSTITNDGLTNKIVCVSKNGIQRISSKGNLGEISIEDFRYVYNQLVLKGAITRVEINQYANRCSSGIFLVFAQVPFIGVKNKPQKTLYLT